MVALSRSDLWSLEDYAESRQDFRAQVLAHKRNRNVVLGAHAMLIFEDQFTVKYQVQEMLRIERIFERRAIEEELEAYNPLIPDGANLKATFMIEYEDIDERRVALEQLKGVEERVWMRVTGHQSVWAIADEDLDRENETKTSAVHFLRFEFTDSMRAAAIAGAQLNVGIDHDAYRESIEPLPASIHESLVADFAPPA